MRLWIRFLVVLVFALVGSSSSGLQHSGLPIDPRALPLHLASMGREQMVRMEPSQLVTRDATGISTRRGPGVTEWWEEVGEGLEHGIDVEARPNGIGPLRLELALSPRLRTEQAGPDAVRLLDTRGGVAGAYDSLAVVDAVGRRLPSQLVALGDRIRIEIDDAAATYPIVVDPMLRWVLEATLVPTGTASGDGTGAVVAISADGTRAVVTAYSRNSVAAAAGSAAVFVRSGTSWTQEASLVPATAANGDEFGVDAAISADGSRIVLGSVQASRAVVFVRSGTTWTEEASLAVSSRAAFGVAIAGDGSRIAVGGPNTTIGTTTNAGQVYVFHRTGSAWAVETTRSDPTPVGGAGLGQSVSFTQDASRLAVSTNSGRAFVYSRSGTTWTQEARLTDTLFTGDTFFGAWVALSGDGSQLAAVSLRLGTSATMDGAISSTRTGTTWAENGAWDFNSGSVAGIALSNDGNSSVIVDNNYLYSAAPGTTPFFVWTRTSPLVGVSVPNIPVRLLSATTDLSRVIVGSASPGQALVYQLLPAEPVGGACATSQDCLGENCRDGVCCDPTCNDSCSACAAARTGQADGTCAPLLPSIAATVTCRGASDVCDVAEVCSPTRPTCPDDAFVAAGNVCRPTATGCDAPDFCTGISASCPNLTAPFPSGHLCRATTGPCDPQEVCDGVALACPPDAIRAAGTVCGGDGGSCSSIGTCDGSTGMCHGGIPLDSSHVCLARDATNPCDLDDLCDGSSTVCHPRWASATTSCGAAVSGECDAPDHCAGTSGDCVTTFLSGVECRASRGGCDPAEVCAGSSSTCPPDQVSPSGMVCRAAVSACDMPESCDGVAASCPTDRGCPDSGLSDAGSTTDGAVVAMPDAGAPPIAVNGCGCRASGRRDSRTLAALALLGLLVWRRRRGHEVAITSRPSS